MRCCCVCMVPYGRAVRAHVCSWACGCAFDTSRPSLLLFGDAPLPARPVRGHALLNVVWFVGARRWRSAPRRHSGTSGTHHVGLPLWPCPYTRSTCWVLGAAPPLVSTPPPHLHLAIAGAMGARRPLPNPAPAVPFPMDCCNRPCPSHHRECWLQPASAAARRAACGGAAAPFLHRRPRS